MIEVGDEKAFVFYAEKFIFEMQQLLRSHYDFDAEPLLPICEKIEDCVFRRTLKDYAPIDYVWMKLDAIMWYQNLCQKILRNLEVREFNWRKVFDEGTWLTTEYHRNSYY